MSKNGDRRIITRRRSVVLWRGTVLAGLELVILGGRNNGRFNFEGRIDEVALSLRTVTAEEVGRHYRAAIGG
jgi:hypothetical protein